MKERRKILEDNICPIKNHVQLSEYHVIRNTNELSVMIAKVREFFFIYFSFSIYFIFLFNFVFFFFTLC